MYSGGDTPVTGPVAGEVAASAIGPAVAASAAGLAVGPAVGPAVASETATGAAGCANNAVGINMNTAGNRIFLNILINMTPCFSWYASFSGTY